MDTDAVVLAGGRITGLYARAAGTRIKALVPVWGSPVIRHVTGALRGAPGIGRVCVVGPEAIRQAAGDGCLWEMERSSALGNLEAGIARLSPGEAERILICASDLPAIDSASLQDFLDRAPATADVCMPVVRREAFRAAFPGNWGIYVRLADGAFTAGGQLLVRPRCLENAPLVRALFDRRKTQLGMARALGAGLVWKLVTRRLTVTEIEERASALAGCCCRAVPDCRPELAFDLDNVFDLRYAERWRARAR